MSARTRATSTAAVGLLYLGLVAAAAAPAPAAYLPLAVLAVGAEVLLVRRPPSVVPNALQGQLDLRFRLLSVDALTAVLAVRLDADGPLAVWTVVVVVLLHLTRDGAGILRRRIAWLRAGGPVSWRNLDVPGLPAPAPAPVPERDAPAALSVPLALLSLVVPAGLALAAAIGEAWPAVLAASAVGLATLGYLGARGVQYLALMRIPFERRRALLHRRIEDAAPVVVLHHSGRRGTAVQPLEWVATLRALRQPVLVLVREQSHLESLDGCGLPVVFAPLSTDVERFMVPSVALALYPSDVTNINNHLIRVPGIYDVLIGHGDADTPANASPIARMYDEVWVAGPLGRERYRPVVTGVRDERVHEIGLLPAAARSGLAAPERPRVGGVVLYAPAWESALDSSNRSSLMAHGERIVAALLGLDGVSVWFAPAAATGSRLPEYADASAHIARLLESAPGEHRLLDARAIPAALRRADLVVTDISRVVTDAVALDVRYAVPVLPGETAEGMRARFPTLAGGEVVEADAASLPAALRALLAADLRAADRAELHARLFAEPGDFQTVFQARVDAAIAAQAARRSFPRPSVYTDV